MIATSSVTFPAVNVDGDTHSSVEPLFRQSPLESVELTTSSPNLHRYSLPIEKPEPDSRTSVFPVVGPASGVTRLTTTGA